MTKRVKLRDIAKALGLVEVGCGDNSCVWGSPGGMATNGGCRCYGSRGRDSDRVGLLMMQRVAAHLLGANRWHVAEMSKVTPRYYACGRHGLRDAHQSVIDEATHIATADPSTVLALVARIRELEAALVEACDGWPDRDSDWFDTAERNALRAKVRP